MVRKTKSKINLESFRPDVLLYSRIHGPERAALKFNLDLEMVKKWIRDTTRIYEETLELDCESLKL